MLIQVFSFQGVTFCKCHDFHQISDVDTFKASLMRNYGLIVDNIIDAYIVVSDGRFLNRESMRKDLFGLLDE